MTTQSTATHVRWMIRRDLPSVMSIEYGSFDDPWTQEEMIEAITAHRQVGMVAERDGQVVGHMVYRLSKTSIEILTMAVHPDHRRQSVGFAMFQKLLGKLSRDKRYLLFTDVVETNLPAQLFCKDMGMRWTRTIGGRFTDGSDAHRFEYRAKF